jgi:GMP synthase-like glutamine amidotransferase
MLHIIQNDPEVPPGNLIDCIEACGVAHVVHHPYNADHLPDLRDISALIVLGGAMGANDDARHPFLRDLKLLIREVAVSGTPYLGICLGGQLLAAALGARVESRRWEELGNLPVDLNTAGREDRLFSGLSHSFATFQWHHDSFDIPEGAVLLAGSADCPHQAYRFGSAAWGIQFHPEVTEQIIRDWCAWDSDASARVDELLAGFHAIQKSYQNFSRGLLTNFLKIAGLI